VYDDALGDTMNITVVATGFRMQPFVDVPEVPTGRVIVLGDDEPAEEEPAPAGGGKQGLCPGHQDSGIEVVNNRRVFEDDNPTQVAVKKIIRKPALILDEDTDEELLRRVPAYQRRKVMINTPADPHEAPAPKLTSTSAGSHRLSSDNAYLDQHLD
jgi:hypothetical protein